MLRYAIHDSDNEAVGFSDTLVGAERILDEIDDPDGYIFDFETEEVLPSDSTMTAVRESIQQVRARKQAEMRGFPHEDDPFM